MWKQKIAASAVSITLALTLISPTAFAAAASSFDDVSSDHWAASAITEMSDRGVMTGIGNNLFAPDKTITYAEFVTMMARQFYPDKAGGGGNTWYAPYLAAAESAGILAGTNVSPNATINRYDMAQIVYNVMKEQGVPTSSLSDTSMVADWASVPSNYQDAVSVCYNMGMLSGVDSAGTFDGAGGMTRAQAAVVLDRLIDAESEAPPTPTPAHATIPAGATVISSVDQFETGTAKHVVEREGVFFFDSTTGVGFGDQSMAAVDTKAYSTFTFTIQAIDTPVQVSVGHSRTGYNWWEEGRNYGELLGVVAPGETKTFTVDCSGDDEVNIIVADDSWKLPGYTYAELFVECYMFDVYLT